MIKQIKLPNGTTVSVRTTVDLAYVIQGDDDCGSVKVGRSSAPERRVAGLISGVPFNARLVAILSDGVRREREMKAMLAEHRLRGEWFKPTQILDSYLEDCRSNNGVLYKHPVNSTYFEDYIRPSILEYLNGRQPSLSWGGDFVYRLIHEGYSALGDRFETLVENCPNAITPEILHGYLPLQVSDRLGSVMRRTAPVILRDDA